MKFHHQNITLSLHISILLQLVSVRIPTRTLMFPKFLFKDIGILQVQCDCSICSQVLYLWHWKELHSQKCTLEVYKCPVCNAFLQLPTRVKHIELVCKVFQEAIWKIWCLLANNNQCIAKNRKRKRKIAEKRELALCFDDLIICRASQNLLVNNLFKKCNKSH